MLFHALPAPGPIDAFDLGMLAVRAAYDGLTQAIASGDIMKMEPVPQNRALEIRYTRGSDFTDEVASEFLGRRLDAEQVAQAIDTAATRELVRPFYGTNRPR
jgi:hypothetical protein